MRAGEGVSERVALSRDLRWPARCSSYKGPGEDTPGCCRVSGSQRVLSRVSNVGKWQEVRSESCRAESQSTSGAGHGTVSYSNREGKG